MRHDIHYPYPQPQIAYQSIATNFSDRLCLAGKFLFHRNKKIGVMLHNGINEFDLAAVMDTYNRTFPGSIKSFSSNNQPVKTKFGLTIIPTGNLKNSQPGELHIFEDKLLSINNDSFHSSKIVKYGRTNQYRIAECLEEIKNDYGQDFERVVKRKLDYN